MNDPFIGSHQYIALLGGVPGDQEYVTLMIVELQVFRRWAAQTEKELRYVAVVKTSGNSILATIPLTHGDDREVSGVSPDGEMCPIKFEAYTENAELEFYVSTRDGSVEYSLKTICTGKHTDDECLIHICLEGLWDASFWQITSRTGHQDYED